MASLARWWAAAGVLTLVFACASLAGLEDPSPVDADAGVSVPAPDGAVNVPDAQGEPIDSSSDAEAGPPPCAKKAKGQPCDAGTECCSDACGYGRKCVDSCTKETAACPPAASAFCCVGLYCSSLRCIKCRPRGTLAERFDDFYRKDSCCSGDYDSENKCR